MTDFVLAFNGLSPLTSNAAEDLTDCLETKSFEKGDLLLKSGAVCNKLFFINRGLTKTFFYKEDKEFIMRFFQERTFCSVLDSFTSQKPSLYNIMALEETELSYITFIDIDLLCRKHHGMETAFRKLMSFAVLMMMKRVSEMLEENATERYNHFLKENGHLLQRISLGDLANYLGITQVSLSRIRGKK
jgi:CRP-like cAMP-binding protein